MYKVYISYIRFNHNMSSFCVISVLITPKYVIKINLKKFEKNKNKIVECVIHYNWMFVCLFIYNLIRWMEFSDYVYFWKWSCVKNKMKYAKLLLFKQPAVLFFCFSLTLYRIFPIVHFFSLHFSLNYKQIVHLKLKL